MRGHFFELTTEESLNLILSYFSWWWCYRLAWAYFQWVGFCAVLLRPLLGHFNYSRAGCNWSRLRGISLSMRMSLGVNTAEQMLPPRCYTHSHTHTEGRRGEMCLLFDFPLIQRGVCLLCVMVKSASQGRLTQRYRRVFLYLRFNKHCRHLWVSSYGALSSCFRVVTHNLKIFIRLLDNASRWGWIIDGLVRMSGTGQAFNSLSCWVSYPVTKGHRTNTQRNDVLEERKKT